MLSRQQPQLFSQQVLAQSVRSIQVAVLGSKDKERVGMVNVLAVLDGAKAVGVAVGEKVLQGSMPVVCEVFE